MPAKKPRSMSPEHKQALADGRSQSRAVKAYLEALETNRPRRGRKRTPESINNRLAKIEAEIEAADPLKRVNLIQEKINLEAEVKAAAGTTVDMDGLEAGFAAVAAAYSASKGITFEAWREVGVSAATLTKAGISRR